MTQIIRVSGAHGQWTLTGSTLSLAWDDDKRWEDRYSDPTIVGVTQQAEPDVEVLAAIRVVDAPSWLFFMPAVAVRASSDAWYALGLSQVIGAPLALTVFATGEPIAHGDLVGAYAPGDTVRFRLQVTGTGESTRFRAKGWVGVGEPTNWGIEALYPGSLVSREVDQAGWVGFANCSNAGGESPSATPGTRVLSYIGEVTAITPSPARVRSHVSEDAGSLFQATQAVAVESAVSETFPYGTLLNPGLSYAFREALTPDENAILYNPIPTRNQEMLVTVEGETNLGRMANVYPTSILERVEDIESIEGSTATAQEAIQYIFDQWEAEFNWFTADAVPDLRVLVDGAVGAERQFYIDHPEAGVLTIEAIAIPQDGNERRSMREIVDEWLAIFTGTIIRQNSNGRIELVPRIGPDAPDEVLELSWRDIITMSDGEDDPRGVRNRARVVSQGYEFVAEQAVAEQAYAVLRAVGGLTVAALEDGEVIPDARVDMGGLYQLLPFTGLASRDDVEVSYKLTAYSSRNPNIDADLVSEGTTSGTLTLAPNGTGTITLNHTVLGIHNLTVRVYLGRATSGDGLMITAVTGMPAKVDGLAFDRYLAYILELDAVGSAWARATGEISGSFGYSSEFLPAEGGGNALEDSVALYGEREAVIRSTVFQLTAEQAQQVARGYVLANINPRTIREVQQSEWDKYPVKFDHIGRLVDLPNGERAVVENRSYSDAFQAGGGMMQSSFTATVTEVVLDTTTAYLFMDDGSYLLLDDGTIAESA